MSPAAIEAIIILVAKYGPSVIESIKGLFNKEAVTIDDVQAAFADLKEYDAFNIPNAPVTTSQKKTVATLPAFSLPAPSNPA